MSRCAFRSQVLPILLLALLMSMAAAQPFIWIEGENPTQSPEAKGFRTGGWGRTQFISAGKMLNASIPGNQVAGRVGADGAVFSYDFTVDEAGRYSIWARIG